MPITLKQLHKKPKRAKKLLGMIVEVATPKKTIRGTVIGVNRFTTWSSDHPANIGHSQHWVEWSISIVIDGQVVSSRYALSDIINITEPEKTEKTEKKHAE